MKHVDPRKRLRAAALVCPLAATLSACGFVFVHGPPTGHEQMDYFACTESNTGPILDVVWGGLNVLGAMTVAADADAYVDSDELIAGGILWGVISGTAAAVGFNKTKRCREARQALAARSAGARLEPAADEPDPPMPRREVRWGDRYWNPPPPAQGLPAGDTEWQRLREWEGDAFQQTESFVVPDGRWRLAWMTLGEGTLKIELFELPSGDLVVSTEQENEVGVSYIGLDSGGTFFLRIEPDGVVWRAAVEVAR